MNSMTRRNFTVIELLAVMAIILILAGMLVGGASFARQKARHSKCVAQLHAIELAFSAYNDDWGIYPEVGSTDDVELSGAFWDSLKSPTHKYYINYQEAGFSFTFTDLNPPDPMPEPGDADYPYVPTWNVDEVITEVKCPFGQKWRYSIPGKRNTASFDLWSVGLDESNGSGSRATDIGTDDSDDVANWKRN